MPLQNPKGYLTKIPSGSDSSGVPSISNTKSGPILAKSYVDVDLEYLRSLGPGPMPHERRITEATLPANTPTVPPDVD